MGDEYKKHSFFFLWMNFAAKHRFLFSITAFVLLCAVDMTDVSCFSHRTFYWQLTTGYLENVELCSMKDCSFEFIATCVSPCWDLFSGRILYPSPSPQPWVQWHFKPVSLRDEQWDAGRIHVGRGGHPHCYYDHALNHCAMTASVFECLEATRATIGSNGAENKLNDSFRFSLICYM